MGILKWLKEWLTTSKKPSEGLGNPDLHLIDIEEIAKELNLLNEAKALGEKGLPAPDAKVFAGLEANIIRAIERHRQGHVNWAVRRLAVISEALSKCQVAQLVNHARQADEEFARKANLRLADFDAHLQASSKKAKLHQEELEHFKAANKLTRQSRHHSSTRSVLTYVGLLFCVLFEGGANAVIFAQGLDTGWLGGFWQALLFAAANVVIAFILGKFLIRQVFHIHWVRKLVGISTTALALVIIFLMALLITHYRDSLAAGVENAAATAWFSMWQRPFTFADIFSVMLCGLSISFGLAALADGLWSDDLYPGYGTAARRAAKSREEYDADLAEAREELEALKEDALAEFEQSLGRSQALIASIQNHIEDKRTTASRFATAKQNVDQSLVALLLRFRNENEKHRGDVPRPSYFDESPELPQVLLPNFDVEPDVLSLNAQRTLVDSLVAEAQAIRARIQASFSQQFDSLKTLGDNFATEESK